MKECFVNSVFRPAIFFEWAWIIRIILDRIQTIVVSLRSVMSLTKCRDNLLCILIECVNVNIPHTGRVTCKINQSMGELARALHNFVAAFENDVVTGREKQDICAI